MKIGMNKILINFSTTQVSMPLWDQKMHISNRIDPQRLFYLFYCFHLIFY